MKTLLRLLSWGVWLGLLMAPFSCRRTLDYQLETLTPRTYQPPAEGTIKIGGPVELNTRVFVIDSSGTDQIVSYTKNQLIVKTTIRLKAARGTLSGLGSVEVGTYIAAEASDKAPQGFLKKVTGKAEVGGEVTLTVEDATFEGLFKNVNFVIEGEVAPSVSLDRTLSGSGGAVSGSLSLKGSLRPSGKVRVELHIKDATVEHALTSVTFKRSVTIGVGVTGALTLANNIELLRRSLPPIRVTLLVPTPFGVPLPLPILITPDFVAQLSYSVGVEGAVDATLVNLTDEHTYGVAYNRGPGWSTIKEEKPVSNNPTLEFKASGHVQLGLRPEFEFSFYDWDGITFGLGAELFGRAEATCKFDATATPPKRELETKLSAGLKADLFARYDLFSKELTGERKVEGGVTFALVTKNVPSDWCKEDEPVPNQTEKNATAVSTGDPHLSTFDKASYSFQAVGEFTAVKSTAIGDNFEVQVRQEPRVGSTQVSLNTGLAIRTGSNEVVCVYPSQVFINGQNVGIINGDRALPSGGKLSGNGSRLTVQTTRGDQVDIRFFGTTLDYDIALSSNRRAQVKGLMGNFDRLNTNDLIRGDNGQAGANTFAGLYPSYADSWRIKQAESLFVYDAGRNTESYTDRNFPRTEVNLTAQQRQNAESICRAAGVTDPVALNNCIVDVALTNDRSFASRALDFQLSNLALNAFSIGEFASSDVQLEYISTSVQDRAAVLDTRNSNFSRVVMRQGVNVRRGFTTEFNFSTAQLNPSSCFYLALWPTDTRTRSLSQNRIGFALASTGRNRLRFIHSPRGAVQLYWPKKSFQILWTGAHTASVSWSNN